MNRILLRQCWKIVRSHVVVEYEARAKKLDQAGRHEDAAALRANREFWAASHESRSRLSAVATTADDARANSHW